MQVRCEDVLLAIRFRDRLERDPAPQQQSDDARPLDVVRRELVATAADEAEGAPLAQILGPLAAPFGQLLEGHPSPRPAAPRYISAIMRGAPSST